MASRRKPLPILIAILVLTLVVAGLLLARRWLPGRQPGIVFEATLPGSARAGLTHADPDAVQRLAGKSRELLLKDAGWIRSLRIAGRQDDQPAEPSRELDALDQIAAAQLALEAGDRDGLAAELARIRQVFRNEDGLIAGTATLDSGGRAIRSAGASNAATLAWLRLLAESHQRLGGPELLTELRAGSEAFLARTDASGQMPADTSLTLLKPPPRQDPESTPPPRPAATPTPEVESVRPVVRIADLDLYAMKLLRPLDTRWQAVFDWSLAVVRGAVLDGPVPLFQYAYDPAIGDYIGFSGSQPLIGTEDALFTLLHLYEAGEPLSGPLAYLRARFYDASALPEQVNRASGASVGADECVTGYACLARIARLADDAILYRRAIERLAWHTATSVRSEAYGAIFRTDPDERIRIVTRDNLWTLLAFR